MLRILFAGFFVATTVLVGLRPVAAQAPVPEDIAALSKQVSGLLQQGKYKETIAAAKRGILRLERNYGRDHLFVAAILQLQALAYQLDGQYPEAVKAYLRVLPIIRKGMGLKHPGVGDILTNLGLTYAKAAQNAEAEHYFKEAFAFYEKMPGDGQINASDRLFNLAGIYQSTARPAEAEAAMKRAIAIREKVRGSTHLDIAVLTHSLGTIYLEQGRFAEAEQQMKRALAIQEKAQGPEDLDVAATVRTLGGVYSVTQRLAEAERLMKRSLVIREKAAGPNALLVADSLLGIAEVLQTSDRHEEAESAARRALAICEKEAGPDSAAVAAALDHIVSNLVVQQRSREAEPLARRTLAIHEKTTGPNSLQTAEALNRLALLAYHQLRYVEAERFYKRALAIHENIGGTDSQFVAVTLAYIPSLYIMQGRFAEAEPIMLRSVAIFDRASGADQASLANALFFLGELYMMQGRLAEAEPIAKRSLGIQEKLYGADNPKVALILAQLAGITMRMERLQDAEALAKKALLTAEKATDNDHHTLIVCLQQLSAIYFQQERFAEAEALVKRALATAEARTSGTEDDKVAGLSQNLALLYSAQGRSAEAEPLYTRSLSLSVKLSGPEHRSVSIALASLAGHYLQLGQLERAADFGKCSADLILRRVQRGSQAVEQGLSGTKGSEAELQTAELRTYVQILGKMQAARKSTSFPPEMFEMAQWALSSEAAQSLAQMGARGVKGDARLAVLVRERQDTVTEWQARDAARNAAIGQSSGNRDARAEADNVAQLGVLDQRLIALDKRLAVEFPDYASLANPAPLSPQEVQTLLKPDEALVLFLDLGKGIKPLGEETLIWVVTKTGTRWAHTDMGSEALKREVKALRCGLDADAWWGPNCAELTGRQYTEADHTAGKPLPFDHGRAYALYKALFGEVEDLIKEKHLLIVESGALAQLPFHVLVTVPPPANGDHKAVAWFARGHAHTVLPAVSSLKTLRQVGRPSAATKPIIGFGNPLLDGPASAARRAQRARDNQLCRNGALARLSASLGLRGGMTAVLQPGEIAIPALIRAQMPLPETADELCAVARDLNGNPADIRLGGRATEREVKALSKSGELMQYRVIHFATHGTLAGQLNGMEPGLILTPPASANAEDDGYLSASEIAGLRLDAELVILSACNTAAGNASSAQALSGLARAFFYAQARTLLVSHWAIDSNATVKLVTAAMAEWKRNTDVGHAEALRRAMLALIDKGEAQEAHPTYWAPFVVVGEGAR